MNVFIITFEQFKASLLNKSIDFYISPPKQLYWPSFWMGIGLMDKITTEVLEGIPGFKTCIA